MAMVRDAFRFFLVSFNCILYISFCFLQLSAPSLWSFCSFLRVLSWFVVSLCCYRYLSVLLVHLNNNKKGQNFEICNILSAFKCLLLNVFTNGKCNISGSLVKFESLILVLFLLDCHFRPGGSVIRSVYYVHGSDDSLVSNQSFFSVNMVTHERLDLAQ